MKWLLVFWQEIQGTSFIVISIRNQSMDSCPLPERSSRGWWQTSAPLAVGTVLFWPYWSHRSRARGPLPFCTSNLQVKMKIYETPETGDILALPNRHPSTNLNSCMLVCVHVCVYVHPTGVSSKGACLSFFPSDCLTTRAPLLPLYVGFCFGFGVFSFTVEYLQTTRFRRQVEGGERKARADKSST